VATGSPTAISSAVNEGLGNDLVAVVLFGSRARGEAGKGSDWDVLIVASSLPERVVERAARLKRMLPESFRGEVSLLAKTPEEFAAGLPELYLDIAVDGVILHDTDEYMAKRLRFLREVIRDKGLQREKDGRNLIWRHAPGGDLSLQWEDIP
jgi:predicted nucleotidyltransferase